jgi:hypothetical protein
VPELFAPIEAPDFTWDVTDEFSTIESDSDRGHRITRARRDRKLRAWRLRWENIPTVEKAYIRAFLEYHLGAAVSFLWDIPDPALYTDGPAFFPTGLLAQGTGGALADGTYNVRYTFENTNGETLASPREQLVISGGGGTAAIDFTMPPRLPADATLFGIYASLDPAVETKQTTSANPGAVVSLGSLPPGAALPVANAMQGQPLVNASDRPRFGEVAANVWICQVVFRELLS